MATWNDGSTTPDDYTGQPGPWADTYQFGTPSNSWYSGLGGGSSSGGGLNFTGLGDTLMGLAGIAGNVEVQKVRANTPLYQRGADGRLYREGVPIGSYGTQGIGGISPMMLLILAGVAIFALKD